MASDNSEQFVLLNHLADEFAARYRKGERPALQEYIDRHPALADDIREFFPAMVEVEQVKADRQDVSEPLAAGPLPPLEPDRLLAKSMSFSRPVVFDYVATPGELQQRADRVWQALATGVLHPARSERFALAAAGAAHEKLESRTSAGSLVLVP